MARKQGVEPLDLIREQWTRTLAALDPTDPPDLVMWAETMHPVPLASAELHAALSADPPAVDVPSWRERTIPVLQNSSDLIEGYLRRSILDALPESTAFATGMETWDLEGRRLQRFNSLVLWEGEGEPRIASKRYLVPGGESLAGLERVGFVRDWILSVAGYIPDLASTPRNSGWSFGQGDRWHASATVCFDNVFASPYLQVLEDGPVHLHLVASNEVWYRASQEYDQMIAFSQLAAAGSGRPMLRVTNSGVSALIGVDGAELERLVVDGQDRNVAGALDVIVPVPVDPGQRTPWSRWWRVGRWVALLAGPLVALVAGRRGSRARVANAD
jgi:apolipoprotein N-acyltransferase